jgi:2-polyprenyl-3-methyl-5-hydroxy-6-metoxy-1,4-benzoquinol methylase
METGRIEKCLELMRKVNLKNKDVLDIGCSGGWMVEEVSNQKGKSYFGIDISSKSIKIAKKKYPKDNFKVGSAIKIPFSDQSFDVAIAFDVLEHIPKNTEIKMFTEINRILNPGGTLILSTPQRSFWGTLLDLAWYFGHRHYTKEQLKNYSKEAGLKITTLTSGGKFWESFGLINLYIRKVFDKEMVLKDLFEKHRSLEYKNQGFVTLFLVASKIKIDS